MPSVQARDTMATAQARDTIPSAPAARATAEAWPWPLEDGELHDVAYRCLPECGFCCTFPAGVKPREERALQAAFPKLKLVGPRGRRTLSLQGGCGACTLLQRRACTAYDLRPQHCRYFPFHVHFGPRPQINVNRTCRGVETAPGGRLHAEFQDQVLAAHDASDWTRHAREAAEVYGEFEDLAKQHDAWDDGQPPPAGPLWAARDVARLAGVDADARWEAALGPFGERDVMDRPFYLAEDLRWWTFEPHDDGFRLLEMAEDGTLRPDRLVRLPSAWTAPGAAAPALSAYLARLEARDAFRGGVYDLVDANDYGIGVAEAWQTRRAEVAADLAVRAAILEDMGIPAARVGAEAERFYDTTFLDGPTIGAWL